MIDRFYSYFWMVESCWMLISAGQMPTWAGSICTSAVEHRYPWMVKPIFRCPSPFCPSLPSLPSLPSQETLLPCWMGCRPQTQNLALPLKIMAPQTPRFPGTVSSLDHAWPEESRAKVKVGVQNSRGLRKKNIKKLWVYKYVMIHRAFHEWGTQNAWFLMENQSINGWLPGTPISWNLHMFNNYHWTSTGGLRKTGGSMTKKGGHQQKWWYQQQKHWGLTCV